jgi:hypothetical protein
MSIVFGHMKNCDIILVPISGLDVPELFNYAVPLKFYEAISMSKPILLFEGTEASVNLLNKHNIGIVCKSSENVFDVLDKMVSNFGFYQENSLKTFYSREVEALKLKQLILSIIKK